MSDVQVKRGNEVIVVPADDAQDGFLHNRYGVLSGQSYDMVGDDGKVYATPAEKVADMVQGGSRFASKHESLQAEAQHHQTRAFVEGLGSQLSFGATDALSKQMGVEGLAERRNTTGGQLGDAAGTAATFLVPGAGEAGMAEAGAKSMLGRVAETALAPLAAAHAANNAAAKAAASALENAVANRAVASAVSKGLGHAVEGAAYNFGGELREESLGDADLNAGHLLAATGLGAVIGGTLGGTASALLSAKAGRLSSAEAHLSLESATGQQFDRKAVDGLWPRIQRVAKRIVGGAVEATDNVLTDLSEATTGAAADKQRMFRSPLGMAVALEGAPIKEDVARAMQSVLTENVQYNRGLIKQVYSKARPELLDRAIPYENPTLQYNHSADLIDAMHERMHAARLDAPRMGMKFEQVPGAFQKYAQLADDIETRAFKAAGVSRERPPLVTFEPVEMKGSLLDANGQPTRYAGVRRVETPQAPYTLRDLADIPNANHKAAVRALFDDTNTTRQVLQEASNLDSDLGFHDAKNVVRDMSAAARDSLVDTAVWGDAGHMQADVQDAVHTLKSAETDLQSRGVVFNKDGVADSASVSGLVNKLDKASGDSLTQKINEYHAATEKLQGIADDWFPGGAPSGGTAMLNRSRAVFQDGLAKVTLLHTLEQIESRDTGRRVAGAYALGPIMGFMAGGIPGAAAATVGMAVLNPGARIKMTAAMMHAVDRVGSYVSSKTGELVGVNMPKVSLGLPRTVSLATIKMLEGRTVKERQDAWKERSDELDRLANGQAYGDHISPQLAGMAQDLPNHAVAVTQYGQRAITALRAMAPMPAPGASATPLDPYKVGYPTDHAIQTWARADKLAQDPLSLLDAVKDGTLTAAQVAVVAQVHPQLLQSMRKATLEHLLAGGGKVSRASSRVMSIFLGSPLSPTLRPANIKLFQSAHGVLANQAAQRPAPRTSTRPRSASSRSMSEAADYNYPRPAR